MVGIVRVEALRHHLRGDFEDLVTQCLLKSLEVLLVDPPRPDERMARRCWTDGDAVGRLVRRREDDPPWLVVGMASDAKVRTLGEAPRNMVYLPYSQRFTPLLTVVARTPIRPGAGRRA